MTPEEKVMSEPYRNLSHSKWNCKYHVVFIPKRRRKTVFGQIRKRLGPIFHELARQKECRIIEGHILPDHVHMCIEIPPKHAVASAIGFIKGKSTIARPGDRGQRPGSDRGRPKLSYGLYIINAPWKAVFVA